MRASTSIWSRYVHRLFGRTTCRPRLRRFDLRRREHVPVYAAAQVLEERALLSAVALESVLSIGNDTGGSTAFDVATDAAGNSYMTGSFRGTVDFDQTAAVHPGDTDILTALGATDAYVAKYAPDNTLLWVQRMGSDAASVNSGGTDVGRRIEIDGSSNVYVVGEFSGAADFGSTILSTVGTDKDGFVAKLNAGGTFQWARDWGTAVDDDGAGVGVDTAGNVYALGNQNNGSSDTYDILKFSPTGAAVWSKSVVANKVNGTGDLTVDGPGNVFVVGSFKGTVDFDPSSKTKYVSSSKIGSNDSAFVLKLDTNGKFSWVTPFQGEWDGTNIGFSRAQSVTLDGGGNIVVGGYYVYSVDFNPGSGTTTLPGLPGASVIQGAFVTKLNSTGGLVWARGLAGNSSTFVYGLDVDSAGSIYATGNFYGTVDLDPGSGSDLRTTAGGGDIYVVKLTAAGNYIWAETFGGTGSDVGFGIAVDPTGGIHLAGYYNGTVDFDPDPLSTYYLTTYGTYSRAFRLRLRQV